MLDYYKSPHTDAPDRPEASYEAHPVETIEPLPDLSLESLPPEHREIIFRLMGEAFEPLLRFMVEEIKLTGAAEKHSKFDTILKEKTVTLRTIVAAYVMRPELFGGVSASELARRLGINKQRFNWYVTLFRKRLGYQSHVMRPPKARINMKDAMIKSHARRAAELIEEGTAAALAGCSIKANPYPEGKQKWKHWRAGFTQAEQR
tara:strand:- start:2860 stop:3471 length:612 start_codon:yes stop_codon:yes gene_type:complete